jgi:S-adenosylmethionine hydrolase
MAIVTLLTDFGVVDTYVGQVKGAILTVCPEARLVDLSHAVPAQDVRTGAFLLWSAVRAFPAGTVHLAVVDPGVGSARRAVAVRCARGDFFVGPDNGLLAPAIERLGGTAAAVVLDRPSFWRADASSTFHGRDIFGPIAGHLARGTGLKPLGSNLRRLERPFALPEPQRAGTSLIGEVLYVDSYGNLVTNIPGSQLPTKFLVEIRGQSVAPKAFYGAAQPGELLALVGSAGLLEISARDENAARTLGARVGDSVTVTTQPVARKTRPKPGRLPRSG